MSYQTTIARGEARATEERWKDHRDHCPACDRWAYRRLGNGCEVGRQLRQEKIAAAERLARERRLDREPLGMEPLF